MSDNSELSIHSLSEVKWAIEDEICRIEEQQKRKKISISAYLKLQDRAIRLINAVEFLQKRIADEEGKGIMAEAGVLETHS